MSKNCPNCAAPYDVFLNKCPYCGTSYFDLTAIDFEDMKPIYLKLKTPAGIITQKCIPSIGSIEFSYDTVDAYDSLGSRVAAFTTGYSVNTDISFRAVQDTNRYGQNVMFTLETEE